MENGTKRGWFHRAWTAVKRGVLGKSSPHYMKQFTGSDEFWDEVIAAQRGWPQTDGKATASEPGKQSSQ
jgi:hypothetical protein